MNHHEVYLRLKELRIELPPSSAPAAAAELFAEVFGDRGRHARSAFGVAQVPLGACVEIELCAEVA